MRNTTWWFPVQDEIHTRLPTRKTKEMHTAVNLFQFCAIITYNPLVVINKFLLLMQGSLLKFTEDRLKIEIIIKIWFGVLCTHIVDFCMTSHKYLFGLPI